MKHMGWAVLAGAAVVSALVLPAVAQTQQQLDWCFDALKERVTPDLQISSCTVWIQSGRLTGDQLARAFAGRGVAYGYKGQYDRAIEDFNQAVQLDPTYAYGFNGRCFTRALANVELPKALADCSEALRLGPNNADNYDSRGFTYLKLGQFDYAIADYNAALKIDPKHASSLYGRGVAKLKKGDTASGDADIAAAKAIQSNIADEIPGLGIK
jgi:tetratricopeptide (TPR) repeat protein